MSDKFWIDIKNLRDIRLFLWLNGDDAAIYNYRSKDSNKKYSANLIYGDDYRAAAGAINDAFRLFYKDPDILRAYASNFKKAKDAMLPLKEFSWFKRCNDACYFTWVYIRILSNKNKALGNFDINEPCTFYTRTYYHRLIKIQYPVSHSERLECIKDFFDRSSMDLSSKLLIMSKIRCEWDRHSPLVNNLPLKKSEKVKIQWAWDYISKDKVNVIIGSIKRAQAKIAKGTQPHQDNIPSEHIFNEAYKAALQGYVHNPHFVSLFRPSTTTEKYLALRCIYICMYCYDNKFLSRFKKSWESSVYRKTKKKVTVREKSTSEPVGREFSNVTDAEKIIAKIPSEAEKLHDKLLLQTSNEKLNEITPTPEIDAGENKEVKDDSVNNWYGIPF